MLAAADLEETLAFYTEVLGFTVGMKSEEYAIVVKDGATIHFMKAADESVMAAVRGHAEIYLEVEDIQPLWAHVQTFRGRFKMTELSDRPYGMTEFHLSDPNDCLVFVGQETRQGSAR